MNVNLQDDDHPVKVGLSDAYIIDRTIYCEYKLPNHMFELKLSSCSTEDYLWVPQTEYEGQAYKERDSDCV